MNKRVDQLDTNFAARGGRVEGELAWVSGKDPRLTVNGLPWFEENGREFIRLPKRAKGVVRDPVWELSTMPSGGRVRFKTDSSTVKLRVQHSRAELAMPHLCAVGMSGIDLYEGPPSRMTYWASNRPAEPTKPYECLYFEKMARKLREFTLYLPTYNDLVLLEIGLDKDAVVKPATAFRLRKPVVVYGTSITQGGCASRVANGHVPLIGRMLGVDVVNLGFSGNGQSEPEMAELVADIDAACYVNDCIANMTEEQMKTRYRAFNEVLLRRHPETPVLMMSAIRYASEHYVGGGRQLVTNAIARQAYQQLRKTDPGHVFFLDCTKVIGLEADHPSVDGCHLTDLGYWRLAKAVAPVLGKILKLRPAMTAGF